MPYATAYRVKRDAFYAIAANNPIKTRLLIAYAHYNGIGTCVLMSLFATYGSGAFRPPKNLLRMA